MTDFSEERQREWVTEKRKEHARLVAWAIDLGRIDGGQLIKHHI